MIRRVPAQCGNPPFAPAEVPQATLPGRLPASAAMVAARSLPATTSTSWLRPTRPYHFLITFALAAGSPSKLNQQAASPPPIANPRPLHAIARRPQFRPRPASRIPPPLQDLPPQAPSPASGSRPAPIVSEEEGVPRAAAPTARATLASPTPKIPPARTSFPTTASSSIAKPPTSATDDAGKSERINSSGWRSRTR